jgi:very-short-patch-repair endonuclease
VTGPIVARSGSKQSGSASSQEEAKAVVDHLAALVAQDFEGTIGIVTFFDYQAKTIGELANRIIGAETLSKHAVKIFTAHKFQGDERDVMLLSLCLGPTMPSGAKNFIQKEKRLLNVAVSRARAICHVFGDIDYAFRSGIPHIETLARKVRQAQEPREERGDDRFDSPWEKKLFDALVERGYSPIPQHPVGGRFLDLALVDEGHTPPKYIDIEVDGVTFHTDIDGNRLTTDLWRDHQLRGLGWKVMRFWVPDLRDGMEACLERIEAEYRA